MENKQPSTTLKVSIGVVRRAVKELEMYRKEVEDGESKLAELSPEDNFYAQTARGLEESKTMVLNTQDRLRQSLMDLDSKVTGIPKESPEVDDAISWSQKAHNALAI